MRLPILLIVLSCLAFLGTARAEDVPVPHAGAAASAPSSPAPAPAPAHAPAEPAPAARREEEAEQEKASLFARLKAHLKGTTALADDLAALRAQNESLQARIAELESGKELTALRDENAAMKADIHEFITFAQSHGLEKVSPAPQTPAGQAAGAAVASAVSRNLSALGVPVAQLPASAAKGADVSDEAIQAVVDQMNTSTDAGERGRLAAKLKTMRAQQAKAALN